MALPYETYNSLDGEENGIHIYLPSTREAGKWSYHSRIAQHGLDKIIEDGGFRLSGSGWKDTLVAVKDWGSVDQLLILDGQYIGDELVDKADLLED